MQNHWTYREGVAIYIDQRSTDDLGKLDDQQISSRARFPGEGSYDYTKGEYIGSLVKVETQKNLGRHVSLDKDLADELCARTHRRGLTSVPQ